VADNEQQMVLVAKLVDQVTDRLKEINKAMLATEAAARKAHGGSAAAAEAYEKRVIQVRRVLHDFHERQIKQQEEHKKRVEQVAEALRGMISGGVLGTAVEYAGRLGAIGIAAGAAYEGIQRMSEALERLGKQSLNLDQLARTTGMLPVGFQRLENTFTKSNIPKEAADQGMLAFADWLQRFKERQSSAITQMYSGPIHGEDYAAGLDRMSPEKAMSTLIKRVLGSKNSVAMKSRILGTYGAPTGIAGMSVEDWEKNEKDAIAKIDPHQMEQNKAAQEEREKRQDLYEKIINSILGRFSPLMEKFEQKLTDGLERASKDKKSIFGRLINGGEEGEHGVTALGDQHKTHETIKEGTKQGFLEGMRQWIFENKVSEAEKFGGGYIPMAYHPDGGGGTGGGTGKGWGGAGYRVLPDGVGGGGGGGGGGRAAGALKGRMSAAKRFMMDQLRREGVPEANLDAAASALVGQAAAESEVNPNLTHDGGTGYGIYGARLDRARNMLTWLKANGYASNSLEGQARYMAHEAMTGKSYASSRAALMGATRGNIPDVVGVLTRNFESPAIPRMGARQGFTQDALKIGGAHLHDMVSRGRIRGSNASKGIGIGDADLEGLDPEFRQRMQSLWDAAPDSAKHGAGVISGRRSTEEQARLYQRYRSGRGGIAAPPGRSRHESGLAADWRDPSGWFHEHAHEYGLQFPLGRRDWPHMQMDPRFDGGLLKRGMKTGLLGPAAVKVNGDASVKIDLNGFPRGTRATASSDGIFKEVTLNRGRSMGLASEDA
jgi:hypothetical protein